MVQPDHFPDAFICENVAHSFYSNTMMLDVILKREIKFEKRDILMFYFAVVVPSGNGRISLRTSIYCLYIFIFWSFRNIGF